MNSLLSYIETGYNGAFFPCASTKLSRSQRHWIININNFFTNIAQLGYQTCARIFFGQCNEITSSVFKAQDVSKLVINSFAAHSFPNCKKFLKVCRGPGTASF